jgi:hypothetical protein
MNSDEFLAKARRFGVDIDKSNDYFWANLQVLGEIIDRIEAIEAIIDREIYNA